MAVKKVFLSHIHEEAKLAVIIKEAIESEFSGFVDVFVSSDGYSIPAGSNFLNRIQDALVSCVGAIFLISPISVKRSWVSFELGAIWIRNVISVRDSGPEIPALPVCHSGLLKGALPSPINNLNAIEANESAQLELAFRSIQAAVGGRGKLRTDFDRLAELVSSFERSYNSGRQLKAALDLLRIEPAAFVDFCSKNLSGSARMEYKEVDKSLIEQLQALALNSLSGLMHLDVAGYASVMGSNGFATFSDLVVTIKCQSVYDCREDLIQS